MCVSWPSVSDDWLAFLGLLRVTGWPGRLEEALQPTLRGLDQESAGFLRKESSACAAPLLGLLSRV